MILTTEILYLHNIKSRYSPQNIFIVSIVMMGFAIMSAFIPIYNINNTVIAAIISLSMFILNIKDYKVFQQTKDVRHILIKYRPLFEYIFVNGYFPSISIEKLKTYDFDKNYHKIRIFQAKNDYEKLYNLLDIWDEKYISLNHERLYFNANEDKHEVEKWIQLFQEFQTQNQNIVYPAFKQFSIKNNRKYIKLKYFKQYYEALVMA